MYRVFIALDLPEPIRELLDGLSGGVPGARWVNDGYHLTLRFVGEVDGGQLDDLGQALGEVRGAPLSLSLKGVGYFPPRQEPRVLWAGVAPSDPLTRLRNAIDRAVTQCRLEPDRRKFHAHITLARLRGAPTDRVARFLATHALFATPAFEVSDFHLYESVLHSEGPTYSKLETYALQPA
jgi:2'-5' RNA ligase